MRAKLNVTNGTFYKIRHKPTGMFYKAAQEAYVKDNLTVSKGTVYKVKPNFNRVKNGYYHGKIDKDGNQFLNPYVEGDWEIVGYEVIERVIQD